MQTHLSLRHTHAKLGKKRGPELQSVMSWLSTGKSSIPDLPKFFHSGLNVQERHWWNQVGIFPGGFGRRETMVWLQAGRTLGKITACRAIPALFWVKPCFIFQPQRVPWVWAAPSWSAHPTPSYWGSCRPYSVPGKGLPCPSWVGSR